MNNHGPRLLLSAVILAVLCLVAAPSSAFMVETDDASASGCGGRIIVVDPGHGGEDSGAVGPGGVREKDITLELAKKLAKSLTDAGGCQVLLTRTDDRFVPLEERTEYANRHMADLFISIHVNSTPSGRVHGLETYFLSIDATDEDARRVAAFENSISGAAFSASGSGSDALPTDALGDLKDILTDLASTEAHHESSALADIVHTALVDATGRASRGVKQAPFVVLSGATMPAVLIEAGFISNVSEERWLSTLAGKKSITESITGAVLTFTGTYGEGRSLVGFNEEGLGDR